MHKKLSYILLLSILMTGCSSKNKSPVIINWNDIVKENTVQIETESNMSNKEGVQEKIAVLSEEEIRMSNEEKVKQFCESIKSIDFSVQEYPINTDIYNSEMDKEYKSAFLQVLFNQASILDKEGEEVYLKKVAELDKITDEDYIDIIKDWFHYYYFDFDGDGFEL